MWWWSSQFVSIYLIASAHLPPRPSPPLKKQQHQAMSRMCTPPTWFTNICKLFGKTLSRPEIAEQTKVRNKNIDQNNTHTHTHTWLTCLWVRAQQK